MNVKDWETFSLMPHTIGYVPKGCGVFFPTQPQRESTHISSHHLICTSIYNTSTKPSDVFEAKGDR